MVQTLSLILLLIFSDVVDSLLGTFAEALDTKNFLVARGILDKKLSMPNQSQEYVTFLTVINRKPWDEIESVINCCGPCKIIPLSFYLTKDTQNTTLFHTLAKEPKSIELMQNIFCQDQDLAIKEVIVTKTRSLPTPLEVAINKKNYEFISKSLLKTYFYNEFHNFKTCVKFIFITRLHFFALLLYIFFLLQGSLTMNWLNSVMP